MVFKIGLLFYKHLLAGDENCFMNDRQLDRRYTIFLGYLKDLVEMC